MTMSSDNTSGATAFANLCGRLGWQCSPIPISTGQTPDFEVTAGGYPFVAEVKTFTPNAEERKHEQFLIDGGTGLRSTIPGHKMRKAIREANAQLKSVANGRPTLLVVMNATLMSLHTDPYAIMTAMQGLDVVDVTIPADPNQRPVFSEHARSGPRRSMTPTMNTTTSAVAVIREFARDQFELTVFQNKHAVVRLDPDRLRAENVRHFEIPSDAGSSVDVTWQQI